MGRVVVLEGAEVEHLLVVAEVHGEEIALGAELLLLLRQRLQQHLLQAQSSEFRVRATIHLARTRAWASHAQWLARAITHLAQTRAWAVVLAQVAHLAQAALQVLVQVRAVLLAPALRVQVVLRVQLVLVLVALVQAAPQALALQELALQVVVQDLAVVVGAVLAPQAHLERVARRTRAASQSALREKNLSRDPHRASVVL